MHPLTVPASLMARVDAELEALRRANPGKVLSRSMLVQHVLAEALVKPRHRDKVAEARSTA